MYRFINNACLNDNMNNKSGILSVYIYSYEQGYSNEFRIYLPEYSLSTNLKIIISFNSVNGIRYKAAVIYVDVINNYILYL